MPKKKFKNAEDRKTHNLMIKHMHGCCCTCRFHIVDHSHPDTDGGSILNPRGWICLWPTDQGRHAFSGWREHGACEEYTPQPIAITAIQDVTKVTV